MSINPKRWVVVLTNSDISYVLFSIGNLKPLFQAAFASCWKTEKICNATWIAAVEYLEICGIIVGQLLVGVLGDWYASSEGKGGQS